MRGPKRSGARFDIAERLGRSEGQTHVQEQGRAAGIYLFAYHAITGPEADHRNALQWQFYVVPTSALPMQKSIGIGPLQKLATPCGFHELKQRLVALREQMSQPPI